MTQRLTKRNHTTLNPNHDLFLSELSIIIHISVTKYQHRSFSTEHFHQLHINMKFKTDIPVFEERNTIEPISSVSPSKSKKKILTKFASKKKKPSKSKRGETKTALSMVDLYEKENPFISTVLEPSIGVSEKALKTIDIEATLKIGTDVASPEGEKGNPDKNPKFHCLWIWEKLGLEDLNYAIDSTENMDVDEADNENVVDNSVQPSLEKTNI